MKIRLAVSDEHVDQVKAYLKDHRIEIDEDAEYALIESDRLDPDELSRRIESLANAPSRDFLDAYDKDHDRIRLSVEDVIYIEAFGKEIELHTTDGTYISRDRMYQLEEMLDPHEYLRISKSVIISRKHVKKIRPSLSMKFILTMSDDTLVDVTRSYYNNFKRFFNI